MKNLRTNDEIKYEKQRTRNKKFVKVQKPKSQSTYYPFLFEKTV